METQTDMWEEENQSSFMGNLEGGDDETSSSPPAEEGPG